MKNNVTLQMVIITAICGLFLLSAKDIKAMEVSMLNQTTALGMDGAAAIKTDGSLWVWGSNPFISQSPTPEKTTVVDKVKFVAYSHGLIAVIKEDGSAWEWGSIAIEERKGNLTTLITSTPRKIMDDVVHMASGRDFVALVKSDGSLWVKGSNVFNDLMCGLGDGKTHVTGEPIKIMGDASYISAGRGHAAVIKKDGSLWSWGVNEYGQIGNGTTENQAYPIKIMDDVIYVSCGEDYTAAIKTDGSLWTWGKNDSGQLGNGTKKNGTLPSNVLSGIKLVSSGSNTTAAIKSDNSLWMCGANLQGQFGNGTTDSSTYPTKVMDNVASVSCCQVSPYTTIVKTDGSLWGSYPLGGGANPSLTHIKIMDDIKLPTATDSIAPIMPIVPVPTSSADYLYNTTDPGLSIKFDLEALDSVTDQASAVAAVKAQSASLTTEQKQSPTGIDLMTLYAEQAVSNAAAKEVSGGIVVNQENVQELQKTAADTRAAVESALTGAGIAPHREINENVAFSTKDAANVTITVESSAANTTADNVRIDTPEYSIAIPKEMIAENTADSPLIITITENNSIAMLDGEGSAFIAAVKGKSYDVKFNKPVKENVRVSLPVPDGDSNYMAVFDEGGAAVGGKYNPTTAKMDVKVNKIGTYIVKENKKDFSDIQSKSSEMQEAISVLSSKGIINGTSETAFSPDATITRAQIAQLITKTLSKLDANANGGFSDVQTSDWFFGAAGSAKAHGIMSGTSETTFSPNVNISKDQIVAVSARVLRNEMKYNNPSNVSSLLNKYSDGNAVPDWAKTDVALATQLNLVVQRTDGSFSPSTTMTRGDAAVILYRMFMKIW